MDKTMIIIISSILILLILYVILKLHKKFRSKVYKLFLKAEKEIKSGEKMDYVVEQLYPYLPNIIKIFISESTLRKILQKMFDVIADFLNDGKVNGK